MVRTTTVVSCDDVVFLDDTFVIVVVVGLWRKAAVSGGSMILRI